MKIKINVVNDNEETSVKDNDLTEYRNSIKPDGLMDPDYFKETQTVGNPVHVGDVLLIKVKDKLFKCEVENNEFYREAPTLFSVKIYPLDKDFKAELENSNYRRITKKNYFDGIIDFYKEMKGNYDDFYHEINFTKGILQFEWPTDTFIKAFDKQPFTVVKFLTKSVPSSVVQDNDLTEYRNSIKPDGMEHLDYFKETRRATGQPVHIGDVLLVKAKDKVFKCEIQDNETFRKDPNLFSVKVYPLDKDYKTALENDEFTRDVLKKNYLGGILNFDMEIKHDNDDTYWGIDFTKGKIQIYVPLFSKIDELKDFREFVPFTVVKFLTRSVPASTVQDAGVNLNNLENDISEDLNNKFSNLYFNCIDFTYLLEDYEKAIEKIIYNDEPSDEYDEDPKDREYKDYLEKVAFCIPDIIYSLKDLEKEIQKRR